MLSLVLKKKKPGLYIKQTYWRYTQVDAKEDEGKSFIFMSENAMTCDKLMVLIHGSGVVRAGQWARRWVVSLETGW